MRIALWREVVEEFWKRKGKLDEGFIGGEIIDGKARDKGKWPSPV
jgi:hypothetical protein